MKIRAKVIQGLILSSAANLEVFEEDSSEEEIYYVKENVPDKTEEDSNEDNEPSKKRAGRNISPLTGKNFQWFTNPFKRTFKRLSSVPNFSAKGKDAAENFSNRSVVFASKF